MRCRHLRNQTAQSRANWLPFAVIYTEFSGSTGPLQISAVEISYLGSRVPGRISTPRIAFKRGPFMRKAAILFSAVAAFAVTARPANGQAPEKPLTVDAN